MSLSREKTSIILVTFLIAILLLAIVLIIMSILLRHQLGSETNNPKEVDIPILASKSLGFIQGKLKPNYNPYEVNLGLAGEIILDCYSGYCTKEKTMLKREYNCGQDDDDDCDVIEYNYTYQENIIEKDCSFECFNLKSSTCNSCSNYHYISSKGKCKRNTNDNYSYGKYCLSDNVIYFWKGEKYIANFIQDISYIKNAKLKNEDCPSSMKDCGILDDNENKLCLAPFLNCPINIISEDKLNISNSSFQIGNKTFYYGYDEKAKNKKIIGGLYVDTDIYLNKKEENPIILDTYTISGLLEENKILYKGIKLGFDPYKEKNIDQKGKSYLKIRYNSKNIDLISLREKYKIYQKRKIYQPKLNRLNSFGFITFNLIGIIAYSLLILTFLFIFALYRKKAFSRKSNNNEKKSNVKFCEPICMAVFFDLFTLIPTVKSLTMIGKINEIDKEINISSLKTINILYILFSFLFLIFFILFIIFFCIQMKRKDFFEKQEVKSASETTINNINNIESDSNIKNL